MKSATIPSLRVKPELRHAVETALHKGETLSSFMEEALQAQVRRRQFQEDFIARGLASRNKAKQTGEYYDADDVLASLDSMFSRTEDK